MWLLFSSFLWPLPSKSSVGVALVKKCVTLVTAKEDQGKAVLAVCIPIKEVLRVLHSNKTECFIRSFKSGCVIRMENDKMSLQL